MFSMSPQNIGRRKRGVSTIFGSINTLSSFFVEQQGRVYELIIVRRIAQAAGLVRGLNL